MNFENSSLDDSLRRKIFMKIAVITRHAVTNYGSLLQSLATQRLIEKSGHSCMIIDYIRSDEEPENLDSTISYGKYPTNIVKRSLYTFLKRPETIREARVFRQMRGALNLTKKFSSLAELAETPPEADVYLTGSDQVWGPVADGSLDEAYFLSFVKEGRKVAFSASIGMLELAIQKKAFFTKHLMDYSTIAVREKSAADFLSEDHIRAEVVLDPALVLSAKEWEDMVPMSDKGWKKDYLLIYQLHNNPKLYGYAKEIAKSLGLQIIRVSPTLHHFLRGGKFVYIPRLEEFLSLIKNASFLMTDSFHGTAFALNFEVPFFDVLPKNGTSSRIVDLLDGTDLKERIVGDEGVRGRNCKIDFSYSNKVIQSERAKSLDLLQKMLMP